MYVCMYVMYVYMYVCMNVWMNVCMYVCMFVCMYVCMYVWMYECIYVCMYVCVCVCVCARALVGEFILKTKLYIYIPTTLCVNMYTLMKALYFVCNSALQIWFFWYIVYFRAWFRTILIVIFSFFGHYDNTYNDVS
jgi:hypothetical protein